MIKDKFHRRETMWLFVLYFTNAWISETNKMWVIVLCFITASNSETNDNESERLMLLDYEFHTVLKYKTITHISFTSLTITSHHDSIKKCLLKQTSNIFIWLSEDLMPSIAFSTSFRSLKRMFDKNTNKSTYYLLKKVYMSWITEHWNFSRFLALFSSFLRISLTPL